MSLPRLVPPAAVAAAALLALAPWAASARGTLAVRGGVVHVVSGPPIEDGVVLVEHGVITAVGPAASIAIPPGTRTLEAAVVTPGLIDAHTVVGLAGHLNQPQDQDQLDASAPIQPELRAIDSYNARERLIGWVRSFGVTTIHAGHAPGALVSGETLIAKTRGDTVDEAVFVPRAMIAVALGESALAAGDDDKKSPGTRSKAVAMLRSELTAAQAHVRKVQAAKEGEAPDPDLRKEALARVLAGEVPLLVTAHRHQDVMSALRVAKEFGIRVVIDGAAEAHALVPQLREAGVPVIVHPAMARASGELENASFTTAGRLREAGIPIALQSGYESYVPKTRVVLFEAAVAAAFGLGRDHALAVLTLEAARILGIDRRVGSLDVGKDGDLALYDGDPFEYTSHCVGVVIEGDVVHEGPR